MVLFTTVCYAQSDFEIAQEFMNKKGVKLVPNKRSATRGADTPYSIFNSSEGKGFCIVANGDVVGYDTSNTIDVDNMPCCLELILSKCSKIGKTRSDYTPDWWTPRNVTPINPLLTTHWHQDSPYNDILQRSGICTIIAFTQILHSVPMTRTECGNNLLRSNTYTRRSNSLTSIAAGLIFHFRWKLATGHPSHWVYT
jgi:hypothetical protein